MHVNRLCACVALFVLAGCSVSRQQQADVARSRCQADHPAVKGNYVALARCLDKADDLYWASDNTNADIVASFQQARLGLSKSVDAGLITPTDYDHRLQNIQSELDREMRRRNTEQLHASWGISHGLDEATKPDANPIPVLPPQ